MKLNREDIITCESYKGLCDYVYKIGDEPKGGLVHVNMEEIPSFFAAIKGREDKYVVVSSCSDFGLAYQQQNPVWLDISKWVRMMASPDMEYKTIHIGPRCDTERCKLSDKYSVKCYSWTAYTFPEIPSNIKRWYMTNSRIHEEIEPVIKVIPFGIAANKQDDILEAAEHSELTYRKNKVYINWVNYTYERMELKELYKMLAPTTSTIVEEAKPYKQYLKDLTTHKIVISPEGNGIDCYRTLEAFYLGAVPFVQDSATVNSLRRGLSLASSYDLSRTILTEANIEHIYDQFTDNYRDQYSKLYYWKDEFYKAKKELT